MVEAATCLTFGAHDVQKHTCPFDFYWRRSDPVTHTPMFKLARAKTQVDTPHRTSSPKSVTTTAILTDTESEQEFLHPLMVAHFLGEKLAVVAPVRLPHAGWGGGPCV